jgi:hypothetical protein
MSQVTLDVVRGLAQAAANAYDGALDDKGEPLEIGLKREKGHPVLDSRVMDGFKVRIDGNRLIVAYQSEIKLRDVYATKSYENDINKIFGDIARYLKKEYKKVTGKSVSLTETGEPDILVQKTSNVRVFVNATKVYKIGGLESVEDRLKPTEDRLDSKFREFLASGGLGNKAENKNQRAPQK